MLVRAAAHTDPPVTAARDDNGTPRPKVEADQTGDARLPGGAVVRLGTTQLRHGDGIFFAAYTPDGKALLTAGKERTIRLWDLATRRELRRFDRGPMPAEDDSEPPPDKEGGSMDKKMDRRMLATLGMDFQVTMSRDGKIVAANRTGTVLLWDTTTGEKLREIKTGKRTVYQLVFSADAKSLLTLDRDQSVSIWDVATGKQIKTVARKKPDERDAGQMAAVSPGFKYLVWQHPELATQSVFLKLMDLTTGEELPTIKAPLGGAYGMVFSADDKLLAWSGFLGELVLWDLAARKELRHFGGGIYDPATSLAFSPDGKLLAASRANATVELWDVQTGKQVRRIGQAPSEKGAAGLMVLLAGMGAMSRSALAFSADGTRLAVSLGGPMIRQFQVATGEELAPQTSGHQAPVAFMDLADDGKSLRSYGHGDAIRLWDLASGAQKRRVELPAGTTGITFGTNGQFASTMGKTVFLRDASGKEVRKIEAGTLAVAAVAVSPDGATLATRDVLNPEVRLWDAATGKARATLGRGGDGPKATGLAVSETVGVVPPALVFSPDGRFLAGAGAKRQLCLWDVAAAAPVWEVAPATGQAILRFVFSPSGRNLAAFNGDGTITLYETATGEPRAHLGQPDKKTGLAGFTVSVAGMSLALADRRDSPVALAFSADGRFLATAKDAPEIHLWDLVAGQKVGRLTGHQGGITSLVFTPDGQRLISGSTDTTALTWDVSRYLRGAARPTGQDSAAPDALWTDLAGADATKAFEAIRRLSATPDRAAALVRERVRPISPPDPERMARWVADLESDRFTVRRQAESELEKLGEQAAPALRKALEGEPSLDLRQRVTRLLRKTSGSTSARGLVRDLRAVELLELAGGRQSQQVLETLAGGSPDAVLTREAKAAASRLAKQQAHK
jgi:WD40 repeat protein